MQGAQIIVLATPIFLGLIALEWWIGVRRGRNTYRVNDALNSLGLGVMSQVIGVLTKLFTLGIYVWVYERFAITSLSESSWLVWAMALLFYDFLYYWLHRFGHTCAVLWAAHVVHHQSEDYNLSTALRQTSSGWLGGWLFYMPMAVLGFPPLVFVTVGLIDLLYQFWVHTQQVGKLGWFDRWFCSPSNHRVHHGVNDRYLDVNYGGILIIWDRIFGTFQEELDDDPVVYGTRLPLRSWDPLWANFEMYWILLKDSWRTRRWSDKLMVWLRGPGWRPSDVAARYPHPEFDIHRPLYDPPMSRTRGVLAIALFVLMTAAVLVFLWQAHELSALALGAYSAALITGLWVMGRVSAA